MWPYSKNAQNYRWQTKYDALMQWLKQYRSFPRTIGIFQNRSCGLPCISQESFQQRNRTKLVDKANFINEMHCIKLLSPADQFFNHICQQQISNIKNQRMTLLTINIILSNGKETDGELPHVQKITCKTTKDQLTTEWKALKWALKSTWALTSRLSDSTKYNINRIQPSEVCIKKLSGVYADPTYSHVWCSCKYTIILGTLKE